MITITYKALKELAYTLSKVTGYRYIAFGYSYNGKSSFYGKFYIYLSDYKMSWYLSEMLPLGIWTNHSDYIMLDLCNVPKLNWSKCQFDCEEEEE